MIKIKRGIVAETKEFEEGGVVIMWVEDKVSKVLKARKDSAFRNWKVIHL